MHIQGAKFFCKFGVFKKPYFPYTIDKLFGKT